MGGQLSGSRYWKGRRVLVTGHTGFKGSWLAFWLQHLGAKVVGLSLPPDHTPNLFELLGGGREIETHLGDIRDAGAVKKVAAAANAEIVFHMAAQALVRESYARPLETLQTNVLGTANVLDACRDLPALRAVVVVTSDKVYEPHSDGSPHSESSRLGGYDPYSASKAASEIVATAWARSFLRKSSVASARAGNVIGGGDWAVDRIVPDAVRARYAMAHLQVRYPAATRPWQHVLEPLYGYLLLAEHLAKGNDPAIPALNFGPGPASVVSVAQLLTRIAARWPGFAWDVVSSEQPHENPALAIDASLATATLGWQARLSLDETVDWTVDWYAQQHGGADARDLCAHQIAAYTQRVEHLAVA